MTAMFRSLPLVLIAFVSSAAFAAEAPDVQTLMTPAEMRATGVDSLSPEQVAALNAWLARYESGATAPAAPAVAPRSAAAAPAAPAALPEPEDDFGKPPARAEDVVSRIAGAFEGWSGRTVFTLENGQVWQQRRNGRFKSSLDNPEVRIKQTLLGAYEMEVISEGRSIGVRRLR